MRRIAVFTVAAAALLIGSAQARADVNAQLNVWAEAGGLAPIDQQRSDDGLAGVAAVSFGWPPAAPPTACPTSGCAARSAGASAAVDEAAGVLRAGGAAALLLGYPLSTDAGADANVQAQSLVTDAITLSAPATVWIEGAVHGTMAARNSDQNQLADPNGDVTVQVDLCCTRGPEGPVAIGGYENVFEPTANAGPTPIDETFSIPVDLPAGRTLFSASLAAEARLLIDGMPGMALEEDALLDATDTVTFHVRVPDDVVATSDSGLLPIVGGASADATPPVSTATVLDPPNANGWNAATTRVRVAAADGSAGSGVDSITVALSGAQSAPATRYTGDSVDIPVTEQGVTTITYSAVDHAGNVEASQQVVVRIDETRPTVAYEGNAGAYGVDEQVSIRCVPSDALSGVAATTCADLDEPAYELGLGTTSLAATATDRAGNVGSGTASFVVTADAGSLARLTRALVRQSPAYLSLSSRQQAVADLLAANAVRAAERLGAGPGFERAYAAAVAHLVRRGWLTQEQADVLARLSSSL